LLEKEKITKIEIEELKRDRAESELKFLKMQINPHFLFNALNNVYIMTYTGDKSAADKIAMLSNMLRYVLYDCKSDLISIEKEIEYINNFIEFQQLKTEKKQNITFVTPNINESSMIAPMLLIPFIENGFKHSRIEKYKDGYVNIKLSIIKDKIHFNIKNSLPEIPVKSSSNIDKGIGIENVKNRLELLYPEKYSLEIKTSGKEFQVTLELFTIDDRK
jgi:LytS/YehU family sensor histidine kinase